MKSLADQSCEPTFYEVIIVDNNSSDQTRDSVLAYTNFYHQFRYVFESKQGLSFARNRGFHEASGEYLAYIDDDSIVPQDYLWSLLCILKEKEPDILGGPIFPYYLDQKPPWFRDTYEIRKHGDSSGFSTHCRVSGGNFVIRKSILKKIGLFDVNLGMKGSQLGLNEDAKVLDTYRLNTPINLQKVYYALECYTKHYVSPYKMKISYIFKRGYISGRMFFRLRAQEGRIELFRVIHILVYSTIDFLALQIMQEGFRKADYIDFSRRAFRAAGIIVELINQLWQQNHRRVVWKSRDS